MGKTMTNPVTPQDYAALLESLRVTEEGPAEMHGQRFDIPLQTIEADVFGEDGGALFLEDWISYLLERLRRAEANGKPSTLLEDVKACVRAAMDAAELPHKVSDSKVYLAAKYDCSEFRKLSEPEASK